MVFFLFQLAFTCRKVTAERAGEGLGWVFLLAERALPKHSKVKIGRERKTAKSLKLVPNRAGKSWRGKYSKK